jgi:2-methylcitrate dehydratase PrpD
VLHREMDARYRVGLMDWLACAFAGREQTAATAARAAGGDLTDRVIAAGAAGHVLDFDDTYMPGLAHLTAPVAPAACLLGAEVGASVGDVLDAYAAGFEAMGAVARAGHSTLYDRGWHPTSVCGVIGSAVASAKLLGLSEERTESATALSLLSAAGHQSAFGSDAKSLQVGFAASAGVRAARLAAHGAHAGDRVRKGFENTYGAPWVDPDPARPAVAENWIKAYPCCLQTHGAIEVADQARAAGISPPLEVVVHPVSRRAAPYDDVADGLQAKFSIPYTVAFTLLHCPPGASDFARVDTDALELASDVKVTTDASLLESEARLRGQDGFEARVEAALGSPQRPMTAAQLQDKVASLAGDALNGILDNPNEPAKAVVGAARLP